MVVLHRRQSQSEEPRSRPPTARDLPSDFRERTVALPVEGDPVIEHRDVVRVPLPFADQDGPRSRLSILWLLRGTPARRLFGDPSQQSTARGFETAESLLLEALRDRLNQKGAADRTARRPSRKDLPALTEVL